MSKLGNIMGVLAAGATLTGGALVLGTATAASASVVMGGVPAPAPVRAVVSRPTCHKTVCFREGRHHNRNHNWNHNRQRQHERQFEFQRQHLLRDFSLIITPFQKSDNEAFPQQKQDTDSKAKAEAEGYPTP
ncbi:hypothetical protein [Planotetraspora kaengkrachanensis]|uniref:Uncharacterized protein n=1 Tax=Planotetraspora kaengkrachanensis TaxID=575193 RepID=A0A8J3Q1C9_9ACTN|nr:hypothetical protein [Planotetraspora kaengkrachanensis]GIG84947.1 hypothetical protein Pka01_80740 [Planotetraspora kaengkrachanensis]